MKSLVAQCDGLVERYGASDHCLNQSVETPNEIEMSSVAEQCEVLRKSVSRLN